MSAGPPLPDFAPGPVGFGESLDVAPGQGSATLTVPLPFAIDRTGNAPPLSLVHTGGGNSIAGLGWSLDPPTITRLGDRGAPRYDDTDRFSLTGVGELSPLLERAGDRWQPVRRQQGQIRIDSFRPVTGAAEHVIERWTDRATGIARWRVAKSDGGVAIYGETPAARLADPMRPARILCWHLEHHRDAQGNAAQFIYKPEDFANVPRTSAAEAKRMRGPDPAATYLKRVRYANRVPFDPDTPAADLQFRLEVVFDYGEHDTDAPATAGDETAPWLLRPDPFSTYPGFEIRRYRRCRALLLFNRYPAVAPADQLTDIVRLAFQPDEAAAAGSRLQSVTRTGRRGDEGWTAMAPPLTFRYSAVRPASSPRQLQAEDGTPFRAAAAPQWTDPFGEGIRHALFRRGTAWALRRNLGGGRFGPEEQLYSLPSTTIVGRGVLGDVETDGARDIVVASPATAGFHRYDAGRENWDAMRSFDRVARPGTTGPGLMDCSGNGQTDLLLGGGDDIVWIESDGRAGDHLPQRRAGAADGPPSLAPAPGRGIFVADMTGSGLADVVLMHNGQVTYWPNLGHGDFGPAVPVAGAPLFDHSDEYDPFRVRFADITGTGVPDLLYLGPDRTEVWENLSGNGFRRAADLPGLTMPHAAQGAELVDLLADGTLCLVSFSGLPGDSSAPVSYLPMMTDGPPGRLIGYANNIGGEVSIGYTSSASHYLAASASGDRWPMPLAAHPIVVQRIERTDHVTGALTVERFTYHDGLSDPESGGLSHFGMVERHDSEAPGPGGGDVTAATVRTWFHAGEREDARMMARRDSQVFSGDPEARPLTASSTETGAWPGAGSDLRTRRAALRSLQGQGIRQEVYANRDFGAPYQVSESRYRVLPVQPATSAPAGRRGGTMLLPAETLVHVYEGGTGDARIEHTLHLAADSFGRTIELATVAYGRRGARAVHPDQAVTHIDLQVTTAAHAEGAAAATLHAASDRMLDTTLSRERFALTGIALDGDGYLTAATLKPQADTARLAMIDFDADPAAVPPGPTARRIDWERLFYQDDAGAPTQDAGAMADPRRLDHTQLAAFPDTLRASALPDQVDAAMLTGLGYLADAGYWWRRSARHGYRPTADFGLLDSMTDPLGAREALEYDSELRSVAAITDASGLRTTVETDYIALQPMRRIDPSGVVGEVRFDPFGRVRARSSRGRTLQADGNAVLAGDGDLAGHDPRSGTDLTAAIADPAAFVQTAGAAALYDDLAWFTHVNGGGDPATAPPAAMARFTRTEHHRDAPNAPLEILVHHLAGSGHPAQMKRRVARGAVFRPMAGGAVEDVPDAADRWLVAGRQVPNAKGLTLRSHAPLHAVGPGFEPIGLFDAVGRATIMHYDPMGRLDGSETPAGFRTEARRTPWALVTYDENDSAARSRAVTERIPAGEIAEPATLAAIQGAEAHRDTPITAHLDAKGRQFLTETLLVAGGPPARTHLAYDAMGRTAALTDPRQFAANGGRAPGAEVASARYIRDMQGVPLVETTADAGTTRTLTDTLQQIAHLWEASGVHLVNTRDVLGRITAVQGETDGDGLRTLEEHRYEGADAAAQDRNTIGRLVETRDQAGLRQVLRYDHAGRALETTRRYAEAYRTEIDWSAAPALETEIFRTRASYDALGRKTREHRADGSEQRTTYETGGTIATVRIRAADGAVDETVFQGAIEDARADRISESYGNGTITTLTHEADTGRLSRQVTRRGVVKIAELDYAYDPVGNLTCRRNRTRGHILSNLPPVPAGQEADRFSYDAHYRLTEATGWTHMAFAATGTQGRSPGLVGGARRISLNDGQMLRPYRRTYRWDTANNLQEMRQLSAAGNFTRSMWVDPVSNRSITRDGPGGLARQDPGRMFDAAGRLATLDHLAAMRWSAFDKLAAAVVIARPGGIDDAEYYVYDSTGQRARKVEERYEGGARVVIETRYLGGCRITRRRRDGTLLFARHSSDALHGTRVLGVVHHWVQDSQNREVDADGTTAIRYSVGIQGGHLQLVLDGAGRVVSYEEHAPFGETMFVAGDNIRDLLPRQHRFAARERDDATGFVAFPFRYLAPWLCRWISPDPLGAGDGPNLYAYAHGNPVTYRDDLGLETDAERRSRQWQELMSHVVSFESLPRDVQAEARSGWLQASALGAQVYIMDQSRAGLHEVSDPAATLAGVEAGTMTAIRTISPEAAELRQALDSLSDLTRSFEEMGENSPFRPENIPDAVPVGDSDAAVTPATPAAASATTSDIGINVPANAATTPARTDAGGTPSAEGNGPEVPGVSVSAAARAASMVPGASPNFVSPDLPPEALLWGDSGEARASLLARPEFQNGQVPRDYGLDGLSQDRLDDVHQGVQSQSPSHRATLNQPIEATPLPEGVTPGQIDPFGPTNGQYGHVGPYSRMTSAETGRGADYLDQDNPLPGERLTEREHGAAGAQLEEVARNPDGTTRYTRSGQGRSYHNDIAYWNDRDAALDKTHGGATADNAVTSRMQVDTAAGRGHDVAGTFVDARENAQRARIATNSPVPAASIDTAIYHQMANFHGNDRGATAEFLAGADPDELARYGDDLDAAFDATFSIDAPSVPDVPNPGRGARALGAVKAGGRVALEALGPLGTGMSAYSFATANTTEDRILTGADLTADLIGYAGPVGAVFSISYGVTRAVDEGIGWASREYLGSDLSPTAVISDGLVEADQALTSLWADPSKPAYTQTIGWKIADWMDSL
ncbi:SpvB/TcaC N-terminal domain-containing protein [Jannaschia rubra]|uniref:Mono(ADP-ribosyl)transferase SpvB n=1 Tax=Jannaschia rubra TaxID=282197 RepID=A0A0M6XU85_9RHOB|nr:SpvB/TcaC N-terminal domain-containing protein [Jannaschia rubra]CTQ34660.1 Mono(ADP-ribosyl)transferase SpvB [Jannaschia rubra]SFG64036.1 RHS repeat-associated core domain-containing protein [Jannaschia rubra]